MNLVKCESRQKRIPPGMITIISCLLKILQVWASTLKCIQNISQIMPISYIFENFRENGDIFVKWVFRFCCYKRSKMCQKSQFVTFRSYFRILILNKTKKRILHLCHHFIYICQKCKKNIFAQNFVSRFGSIFGPIHVFWDANQKIICD